MTQEKNNGKVAVIIPAYNAAAYIASCLESILSQNYQNLEVLVVNDGSTDDTAGIVTAIAQEDPRVLLKTVPNAGPAKARNYALDTIGNSADYIMFCDADDLMEQNAVQMAVEEAKQGADLVLMGFSIIEPDQSRSSYSEKTAWYYPNTLGQELGNLYKANLLNQVWGKLFRAELIEKNQIRFPDYRWGEDRFFVFDCLSCAKSVSVLSAMGYLYIMYPGSLINSYQANKAEVCVRIDQRVTRLCEEFHVAEDAPFRYMFIKSIFSCMVTLFSPKCPLTGKEKCAYIRRIVNDEYILSRCKGGAGGTAGKAVGAVLSSRSVLLNYCAAGFAAGFGSAFPELFRKIKHKK